MSHEVNLAIVAKENLVVRESHCEVAPVNDEEVKENKEEKHIDLLKKRLKR